MKFFSFHLPIIDSLRDRGEKLELLVNKTENLSNNVSVTISLELII